MSVTVSEKLKDRLQHAIHHREQLDAIASDMAGLMNLKPGSVAAGHMRSAVYGVCSLNDALQLIVNGKLAELAAMQIEGDYRPTSIGIDSVWFG
jgi:hypothetical protein